MKIKQKMLQHEDHVDQGNTHRKKVGVGTNEPFALGGSDRIKVKYGNTHTCINDLLVPYLHIYPEAHRRRSGLTTVKENTSEMNEKKVRGS